MGRSLLVVCLLGVGGCTPPEEKYCALAIDMYPRPAQKEKCLEHYRKLAPTERACADVCVAKGGPAFGGCLINCGEGPMHHDSRPKPSSSASH